MSRLRPLLAAALLVALGPSSGRAQMAPRPEWLKGHRVRVRIDSVPQQAAVYIDSKDWGIQGYTPTEMRLPAGSYRIILELPGYSPNEHVINVVGTMAPLVFQLAKQVRPAVLEISSAGDGSATGANIVVDGTAVGAVPNRIEVPAGTHTIEVKRPGYQDYRDTVPVQEGERRTMVVALVPQIRPGSLLITADVPNAEVFVDGARRDSVPTLVADLPEGDHTVEVRKDGGANVAWKQVVHVTAGQQTKVFAQLQPVAPPAATTGSIRVLSQTPMADVILDGEPRGPANAEIADLRPGIHVVEVRAQGFEPKRVEVEVRPGEMRAVTVDLAPAQPPRAKTGGIHVVSDLPGVNVFLDGAPIGQAPLERHDVTPGHHFIVATRPGYAEFRTEIELQPGQTLEVVAALRGVGELRIASNPPGADAFLDGAPVGRTPTSAAGVAAGDHVVELRMKDYADAKTTVRVEPGKAPAVAIDLQPLGHAATATPTPTPTPTAAAEDERTQSSFGAVTLAPTKLNVDVGFGYPYFFDVRLRTGIWKRNDLGVDLGIEFRTSGYENEVGARPRVEIYRIGPLVLGADLAFIGGGGPSKRDSFNFEMGAIATLVAGPYVHINLRPYLWVSTDRLCPSVDQIQANDADTGMRDPKTGAVIPGSGDLYAGEHAMAGDGTWSYRTVCEVYDNRRDVYGGYQLPDAGPRIDTYVNDGHGNFRPNPTQSQFSNINFGQLDPRERFTNTRFMIQVSIEVLLWKNLSLWGLLEGAPGQSERLQFTDIFNSAYPHHDFPLYGQFGVTGKF